MESIVLDNLYTKNAYPKKGVIEWASDHQRALRECVNGTSNPEYAAFGLSEQKMCSELLDCANEQDPFGVAMAAMCCLYWRIKGPEYNYGGCKVNELNKETAIYRFMCTAYGNCGVIYDIRKALEKFPEDTMPELKNKVSEKQLNKIEELYYKLLLLVYDYTLEAIYYEMKGDVYTVDKGYTANTTSYDVGYATMSKTTFEHNVSYNNTLNVKAYPSLKESDPEFYNGCLKGREMILKEVLKHDPDFPTENTWLYYGINKADLNRYVEPIYGVTLPSCRNEKKRKNVRGKTGGDKFKEALGAYFMLPFTIFSSSSEDKYPLIVGGIEKGEEEIRRTIHVIRE